MVLGQVRHPVLVAIETSLQLQVLFSLFQTYGVLQPQEFPLTTFLLLFLRVAQLKQVSPSKNESILQTHYPVFVAATHRKTKGGVHPHDVLLVEFTIFVPLSTVLQSKQKGEVVIVIQLGGQPQTLFVITFG